MHYLKLILLFALAALVNALSPEWLAIMDGMEIAESVLATSLWCVSLMLGFGWACSKLSAGTVFPSFTLQLLIGIVLHDALQPLSVQLVLAVV